MLTISHFAGFLTANILIKIRISKLIILDKIVKAH